MRSKMMNVAARLDDHLVAIALALLVLLPALVTVADSDHRSTAVLPPLAQLDDAMAEGTDVLPVAYHDGAKIPELWNALRETMPGAYHDDVPGIGTFYVPVGSAVFFEEGMFLATLDGFMVCIHGETTEVCSPTGPVMPTSIETRTATEIYGYMTSGTVAQCGTDAQCAALDADRAAAGVDQDGRAVWVQSDRPTVVNVAHEARSGREWRLAEDGSWVPARFYDRVTATGATQARCDYLGKTRVPDARYGYRCA